MGEQRRNSFTWQVNKPYQNEDNYLVQRSLFQWMNTDKDVKLLLAPYELNEEDLAFMIWRMYVVFKPITLRKLIIWMIK